MKLLKGIGLCLIALAVLVAPKAKADAWNHKTIVTFSGPVEVPGVGQHILPAGTYVFKLIDSPSDRHIVQIYNEQEDHLFTTILAVPNFRLRATGKTVMIFSERPAGEPEALKAWFYPGHTWGEEFVYERSRAVELAKQTNEPVLSTPVASADTPAETAENLNTTPVEGVGPTGESVDTATVVEAPPAEAPAAAPAPAEVAQTTLPKTASDLPLIGLLGLLMLGGGFALFGLSKLKA